MMLVGANRTTVLVCHYNVGLQYIFVCIGSRTYIMCIIMYVYVCMYVCIYVCVCMYVGMYVCSDGALAPSLGGRKKISRTKISEMTIFSGKNVHFHAQNF